jgi:signal-transduction protein with cAMP-binding, CBS, and nucleotidyltransferase domain
MSKKIKSIAASENAQKAAKRMRAKNVSSLVVIDKEAESPVGILTEGDLAHRIYAEGGKG